VLVFTDGLSLSKSALHHVRRKQDKTDRQEFTKTYFKPRAKFPENNQ